MKELLFYAQLKLKKKEDEVVDLHEQLREKTNDLAEAQASLTILQSKAN